MFRGDCVGCARKRLCSEAAEEEDVRAMMLMLYGDDGDGKKTGFISFPDVSIGPPELGKGADTMYLDYVVRTCSLR